MSPKPTKAEILERCKDHMTVTEWEILTDTEVPTPEVMEKDKTIWEFIGFVREWKIYKVLKWTSVAVSAVLVGVVTVIDRAEKGYHQYQTYGPVIVRAYSDLNDYVAKATLAPAAPAVYLAFDHSTLRPHAVPPQDFWAINQNSASIVIGTAFTGVSGSNSFVVGINYSA